MPRFTARPIDVERGARCCAWCVDELGPKWRDSAAATQLVSDAERGMTWPACDRHAELVVS